MLVHWVKVIWAKDGGSGTPWGPAIIFSEKKSASLNSMTLEHMYRKSPTKFERKFQCKFFHGRPLLVQVPKIRTSPNASFWLIWTNWDMKEMEMWPKAIMVWKYDGSRPTRPKIAEVSSPGPEIWFFYKKNQWFATDPTVQHMQKETNICFQYNAYSLSLIIF